jgi:hypothetical protein
LTICGDARAILRLVKSVLVGVVAVVLMIVVGAPSPLLVHTVRKVQLLLKLRRLKRPLMSEGIRPPIIVAVVLLSVQRWVSGLVKTEVVVFGYSS